MEPIIFPHQITDLLAHAFKRCADRDVEVEVIDWDLEAEELTLSVPYYGREQGVDCVEAYLHPVNYRTLWHDQPGDFQIGYGRVVRSYSEPPDYVSVGATLNETCLRDALTRIVALALDRTAVVDPQYDTLVVEVGAGAYPYDCIAKDERPDDMIYIGVGRGWTMAHVMTKHTTA